MQDNTPNKWHSKKASTAILISDKIDKPKSNKRQIWTVLMIKGQLINY